MSATFLALLSAISFALGTVLQQKGTLETKAQEGDPHFLAEILHKPIWLAGGLCQVAGWILQAAALGKGSLAVVQAICSLSLVIALPLGARLTNQHVGRRSVAGALITMLGIIVFVAVGQPQGGSTLPSAADWISSIIVIAVLIVVLTRVAGRKRGPISATLFATSAGLCFAFQAAVTKVFMTELGNGIIPLLLSWTSYALLLSALVGFGLQQSALKTGYLAPAMAASNATNLIISVLLGIVVFQESISSSSGRAAPAILGLILAVIGVVLLSTPETPRTEIAPQ
jgi:drug/metabolite transporter (DMT)-like permease